MFKVAHKNRSDWTYQVYAVAKEGRQIWFLLWTGTLWLWEEAEQFIPVE